MRDFKLLNELIVTETVINETVNEYSLEIIKDVEVKEIIISTFFSLIKYLTKECINDKSLLADLDYYDFMSNIEYEIKSNINEHVAEIEINEGTISDIKSYIIEYLS